MIFDRTDGRLLAWALLFPHDLNKENQDQPKDIHLYVRPTHRRRGLGTELLSACRRYVARPCVMPWDEQSSGFYSSQKNITIAHGYKNTYRRGLESLQFKQSAKGPRCK